MEILTRTQTHEVEGDLQQDDLWLSKSDFETITEFEFKPEGFCQDETCIPVPASQEQQFIEGDRINLSAFARLNQQPLVCDADQNYWFLDDSRDTRNRRLRSRQAPDFELPDLDGTLHRLSDYLGKKILLASWASW